MEIRNIDRAIMAALFAIIMLVGGIAYLDNQSNENLLRAIQSQNEAISLLVYSSHSQDYDLESMSSRQLDLIAVVDSIVDNVNENTKSIAALHLIEEERMSPIEVRSVQ